MAKESVVFNLVWKPCAPVISLNTLDLKMYPIGPCIYRLQFSDGVGLHTYVGETEVGIRQRIYSHLRNDDPKFSGQHQLRGAIIGGSQIEVSVLSEESGLEIGSVQRALDLGSADERLLLEDIVIHAAKVAGEIVLNKTKINRSARKKGSKKA